MKKEELEIFYKNIHNAIDSIEENKIQVLYFSYDNSFYNIWHKPALFLTTKLLSLVSGRSYIDHVAHISRVMKVKDFKIVNLYEAHVYYGMQESSLHDRLKNFRGTIYIDTFKNVNKKKAKKFEKDNLHDEYSKIGAFVSGLDLTRFFKKLKGNFCSKLVSMFLIDQGIKLDKIENGNPNEITPVDLFEADLVKNRRILYKYSA